MVHKLDDDGSRIISGQGTSREEDHLVTGNISKTSKADIDVGVDLAETGNEKP